MNRRVFLRATAALTGLAWVGRPAADEGKPAQVMTVQGPVAPRSWA